MVIGIFGESCVGKSTVAAELQKSLNAEVYAGKDYLSLDKAELISRESTVCLIMKNAICT